MRKIGDLENFRVFNIKYRALWQDIKVSEINGGQSYNSIFVLRRFLYACIIILGPYYRVRSIFVYGMIIFLNLFYTSFLAV